MLQATPYIDEEVIREAAQEVFRAPEYNRFAPFERVWDFIVEQFGRALAWLLQTLAPLVPRTGLGRLLLGAIILTLVAVAIWIGITSWRQREARLRRELQRQAAREHTLDEAERLAEVGRFTEAAHVLYAALLVAFGRRGHVRLHSSKTIGDYLRELRRGSPALLDRFREFARTYELVIYGLGECDRERYDRLRSLAMPLMQGGGTLAHD